MVVVGGSWWRRPDERVPHVEVQVAGEMHAAPAPKVPPDKLPAKVCGSVRIVWTDKMHAASAP